MTQTDFCKICN